MTSLNFPDVTVWLALILEDHVHRSRARQWWESEDSGTIAFIRTTQIGVLRLLTTAPAMGGKPLTMTAACQTYDRFFVDDRIVFMDEPAGSNWCFGVSHAPGNPHRRADAWLLAFADAAGGVIVTFDRALAARSRDSVLL